MSDQYEVLAVRYGTRQASAAEVFLNYHAYHEPDRPLQMDYFFWVARNPAPYGRRRHRLLAGRRRRPRPHHAHGHGARLACGRPDARTTITQVVLTHAHYDHIGGLPAFTGTGTGPPRSS